MESEALNERLEDAQQTLQKALDAACSNDLSKVDTGELIRIEETLAIASKAAKEAVSVRLKRRKKGGKKTADEAARAEEADSPVQHRVFEDIRGKRWHAFAVLHTEGISDRAGLPEAFKQGWLAFESDDELRRVAPIPEKWAELSADELRLLCHNAKGAPRRIAPYEGKRKPDGPAGA